MEYNKMRELNVEDYELVIGGNSDKNSSGNKGSGGSKGSGGLTGALKKLSKRFAAAEILYDFVKGFHKGYTEEKKKS